MWTWILFGIIVAALVIYFIYSFIKDKIAKKRRKLKQIELINKTEQYKKHIVLRLHFLIKHNQKLIDEFVPSIGEYKMNYIVDTARKYLIEKQKESDFKELIIDNIDAKDIFTNYTYLRDVRSTNWRNLKDVYEFINSRMFLIDEQVEKDNFELAQKEIEEFYNNEIQRT